MSKKLQIALSLLGLLAVLAVTVFSITGWATTEEHTNAETVAQETMSAHGIEAPVKSLETLSPVQNVLQADENPSETGAVSREESDPAPYRLSDEERIAVESAVMCEAGGECVEGQMMVAQCILDGTLRNHFDVFECIDRYQIASTDYSEVTQEVKDSVSRIFDNGERVTEEKADLWYNPAIVQSAWHEEQQYVITIGLHRFFWMNNDMN